MSPISMPSLSMGCLLAAALLGCSSGTASGPGSGGACTPESDAAFCTRQGKYCGAFTGTDNCNAARTAASCGTCTAAGQICGGGGTANVCGGGGACTPESDAAFCTRQGKYCGAFTGTDNCNAARTAASCGTCAAAGQTCGGGGTANVCGGGGTRTTWVAGDLPDYQWSAMPPAAVPWDRIDQLNIGMLWPMSDGAGGYTLGENDWDTSVAKVITASWRASASAYTAAGHAAGAKILCLLGGAGGNPNPSGVAGQDLFHLATDTDAHAAAFAQNVRTVLTGMGFDGVDLDWEDGSQSSAVMYAGLVRLAHQLRLAWPAAVIVIPTWPTGEDAAALAPAKDDVDAYEPMTYMDAAQWGGWVLPSPLTPLHDAHGNTYSIERTLAMWTDAGVPASKVLLGVGGYGAAWTDRNGDGRAPNVPYANAATPGTNPEGESSSAYGDNVVTQAWLDGILAAHPELVEGWDDTTKSSYWGAPSPSSLVTIPNPRNASATVNLGLILYESPRSIGEKAAFAQAHGMRGLSFWTLAELVSGGKAPILDAIP